METESDRLVEMLLSIFPDSSRFLLTVFKTIDDGGEINTKDISDRRMSELLEALLESLEIPRDHRTRGFKRKHNTAIIKARFPKLHHTAVSFSNCRNPIVSSEQTTKVCQSSGNSDNEDYDPGPLPFDTKHVRLPTPKAIEQAHVVTLTKHAKTSEKPEGYYRKSMDWMTCVDNQVDIGGIAVTKSDDKPQAFRSKNQVAKEQLKMCGDISFKESPSDKKLSEKLNEFDLQL